MCGWQGSSVVYVINHFRISKYQIKYSASLCLCQMPRHCFSCPFSQFSICTFTCHSLCTPPNNHQTFFFFFLLVASYLGEKDMTNS